MATLRKVAKDGWIYAPCSNGIGASTSRIFGLPKSHRLSHAAPDGEDHLAFHVWALSFFEGIRLTTTELGFLDATPFEDGKLVDFVLGPYSRTKAVELAERFWVDHRTDPRRARMYAAAVHALFLGQNPRLQQFERFILLYTALDACFALAKSLHATTNKITHEGRVAWMCDLFGMDVPSFADPSAPSGSELAALRNGAFHEALFNDQPLGFKLHRVASGLSLTHQVRALICRFLVALIGGGSATYIRASASERGKHGLDLI